MSGKFCPYCNSAQSILMGNVYCSHQPDKVEQLDSGTLLIKSDKLEETSDHITRLSIRATINGTQYYKVGSHEHTINPSRYLIMNQGQHYRTSFSGTPGQEMILVAFKPSFAADVLRNLITADDKLLDNPFSAPEQQVVFFEKTYDTDPEINRIFKYLRNLMDEDICIKRETDLHNIYGRLLERMLYAHRDLRQSIDRLKSAKLSTRTEIFRRLSVARDYMDANADKKMALEEVSAEASLSLHHFKRLFKEVFKITPHRYHIKKRLEYSCLLLKDEEMTIDEVCRNAGFENSSSFIRLFKGHYGCTPGVFGNISNESLLDKSC